jgi:predicted transcriptional regulator
VARSHAGAAGFRRVQRLFALFGHATRLVVFQRLARRPSTAGELARNLPVSRTAIVQHLKQLEAEGLVGATTHGRRRVYHCRPEGLAPLADWLAKHAAG